jgi:hypothetical protein
LLSALQALGFTVAQIDGGLNQLRNVNCLLARADRGLPGLVLWSKASIAKFERGETLRNEFEVLWSPDISLVVMVNADATPDVPRCEEAAPAMSSSAPEVATVDAQPAAPLPDAPPSEDAVAPAASPPAPPDGVDLILDRPIVAIADELVEKPSLEEFAQWLRTLSEADQAVIVAHLEGKRG